MDYVSQRRRPAASVRFVYLQYISTKWESSYCAKELSVEIEN